MKKAEASGNRNFSHFGPEANIFDELEKQFKTYGETGTGKKRYYCTTKTRPPNTTSDLARRSRPASSPMEDIPSGTDLMFYEGLHGGVVDAKARRGCRQVGRPVGRGGAYRPISNGSRRFSVIPPSAVYSAEAVVDTILRRMYDYVHYITPQFSRSHIDFQRVPIVDTSTPLSRATFPRRTKVWS